ncbi:hypothetical protein [Nocardia stercoris]|uniref:DUF8020 domain-containing protein n=1 Tax=Nocardia stercoris TaxID=2483361 RepID=A0A3M2L9Z1_9NOCA|nr:hypothetical protein [Nocardia stercoris]RMI34234.1 hypothetical protein EBN03_07425 [Nocardia stercoris]
MRINKFAATSALVIGAIAATAGTVHADPVANAGDKVVNYTATATDTSAIIKTDAGSLVNEDGKLEIKAPNGNVLAGIPLSFRVDDFTFPVAADINGNTATLSPKFDLADATYAPVSNDVKAGLPANSTVKNVDLPFQDQAPWKTPYDREQAAFNRLKDTISMGATIGAAVGAIGGAALGCVLGGVAVGGGATLATGIIGGIFSFLPGALVGCIAGAAATGFLGTIGGALLVTIPVAIGAAIQYFTTTNEPFNPPAPAPAK